MDETSQVEQSILFEFINSSLLYISKGDKVRLTPRAFDTLTSVHYNETFEVVQKVSKKRWNSVIGQTISVYSTTERLVKNLSKHHFTLEPFKKVTLTAPTVA